MIIATLTFLASIFGINTAELFFLNDFDKGVKEYVIDKERQKQILINYKDSEKIIKTFNKNRKSDFSRFQEMNISRNSTENDFSVFFKDLHTERDSVQNVILDLRIAICEQVSTSEWDSIVAFSVASYDKTAEKAQKKANKKIGKKTKKPFDKTRTSIMENVISLEKQKDIIDGLDALILQLEKLGINLKTYDVNESSILKRKEASKTDLLKVVEIRNEIRIMVYRETVGFHMVAKENTASEEWKKIIKAFNKEMTISNF